MTEMSVAQGVWTGMKSFGASGCWARDWVLTLGLSSHTVEYSHMVTTHYLSLLL